MAPGIKLVVGDDTVIAGIDVSRVVAVVDIAGPANSVTGVKVVVLTGAVSKGKPIDPALIEVGLVTVGALVPGTDEPGFENGDFFFFLADGFATGLRTTRTGVALAERARLIWSSIARKGRDGKFARDGTLT